MDEFKKYLRHHRDELDTEPPPGGHVWDRVRLQVAQKKQPAKRLVVRWAAAVLLAAGVTYFAIQMARPRQLLTGTPAKRADAPKQPMITGRADSSKAFDSPVPGEEIAEVTDLTVEKSAPASDKPSTKSRPANDQPQSAVEVLQQDFAAMIDVQLEKLQSTPIYAESPDYLQAFKQQWNEMEEDEIRLKKDLDRNGLSNDGIAQYIQIYQQKLFLLRQLQDEINKINTQAGPYLHPDAAPTYFKL